MKRRIFQVIGVLAFALAKIDTASAEDPATLQYVNESDDVWLHAHCAFLGTGVTSTDHLSLKDGEVAVSLGALFNNKQAFKRFACVEKPAFYKQPWKPAVCASFAEHPQERASCEAKLTPPPPPPVVFAPPPPPVEVVVPPPAKKKGKSKGKAPDRTASRKI